MREDAAFLFAMAALCANTAAMGFRSVIGRQKTNSPLLLTLRSASSHSYNLVSQSMQTRHKPGAWGIGSEAFVSASFPEQRVGLACGDRWHRSLKLGRPRTVSWQLASTRDETTYRWYNTQTSEADVGEFFANAETHPDFSSLAITSPSLLHRLSSRPLSLRRPSAVQAAVFDNISRGGNDVIVGAETGKFFQVCQDEIAILRCSFADMFSFVSLHNTLGSGKTLAYLLPLVDDILKRKREWKAKMLEEGDSEKVMDPGYNYARAIVLVPNKELAHQAARMAAAIGGGLERCIVWGADALGMDFNQQSLEDTPEEDVVRLAIFPGGLSAPKDFPPFRYATSSSLSQQRQPPPDLVFTTPASLGPLALSPKNVDLFADVSTLVIDEADMLLDGGYIKQLNNVLMGFRRADRLQDKYGSDSFRRKNKANSASNSEVEDRVNEEGGHMEEDGTEQQKKTQHVFVAATIPDYGLKSVDAYLHKKFPNATRISMTGMHNARHYGLENETQTIWNEIEDNKSRMQRLVDVLRLDPAGVGVDGRGLKGEKVMVFLTSVKDVDGATNGLRRAGIDAVPFHAKLPLADRTKNLDRFRRYHAPPDGKENFKQDEDAIPVLVCTDAASRGFDIPGVNAIVQLQFATNVVFHLHRMGRCGRAGNRNGRGIVFYGAKQRELVEVVREAEEHQSRMTLIQDVEEDDDAELEIDKDQKDDMGKVRKAFSRKRGFTQKRKKQRRRALEANADTYEYD